MRTAYRVLAVLISIGVVVQAATIAWAGFVTARDIDAGAVTASYSTPAGVVVHAVLGQAVIPALAVALFVVAFGAKVAGGVRAAGIVLVVVVAQVLLAYAAAQAPWIGLLHGATALAVVVLAGLAARRGRLSSDAVAG